jgi:alpha/beta superfamily hydrolase
VTFTNSKAGNSLAGTLTMPLNVKVSKIVVLITGSGPDDRNAEAKAFNHRPFLVWSDWLTRNGIAVLRYDDRGVGKSTGDFAKSTTSDFADDAQAAVNYIHSRQDLKFISIGLIGHSEGGVIAAMVASRNNLVSFICLLAGPGIPAYKLMVQQQRDQMRLSGASTQDRNLMLSGLQKVFRTIHDNARLSPSKLKLKLDSLLYREVKSTPPRLLNGKSVEEVVKITSARYLSPWFKYYISIEPADYLSKVKCPVLALNGTLDIQIECTTNLAAIKQALQEAGNKNHQEIAVKGLNHLFQKAKTGATTNMLKFLKQQIL